VAEHVVHVRISEETHKALLARQKLIEKQFSTEIAISVIVRGIVNKALGVKSGDDK